MMRLLKVAGDFAIVPMVEDDAEAILKHGQVFDGRVKMMRGAPSQCHRNSTLLWEANRDKGVKLCTGYGMTWEAGFGLWRQHSWCWVPQTKTVLETTSRRHIYFGVIFTNKQANEFLLENAL
jgi:hypothetical protein